MFSYHAHHKWLIARKSGEEFILGIVSTTARSPLFCILRILRHLLGIYWLILKVTNTISQTRSQLRDRVIPRILRNYSGMLSHSFKRDKESLKRKSWLTCFFFRLSATRKRCEWHGSFYLWTFFWASLNVFLLSHIDLMQQLVGWSTFSKR